MFRTLTAFVLVAMATSGGRATGHARDPWPELKKLDYFAGDWSQVGDEKAGPWGPGGRVTMHDHGVWMEGGYFIVIHSTWTGLNSQGTGIEFLGYDPIAKVYTYDEFYSQGEAVHSKGRVDGDTWVAARVAGPDYAAVPHRDVWSRGIMAHTSPIYVACGAEWGLADPATAQYMLTLIDGNLAYIRELSRQHAPGTVTHHHGEHDHLAYLERPFREAEAALRERLGGSQRGGR